MKYIKKFKHEEDFNAFKDSDKYVTPNVSYIHGVEKSKLRRNIKFKIKDTECNMGEGMTWEEWSKQKNHKHFGNEGFATTDGKVFNTDSLYVYKKLPTYELKENAIIPQHVYDLYDDPDKVIFYTSTDGNIVKPSNSNLFGGAKLLSNEYKDGLGRMVFDKKITSFDTIGSGSNQSDFPFSTRKTLKSIWIPDSVERINAFGQSCDALETIVFGKNVTYIGKYAFNSSDSLTNVIFGENLVEIAPNAFRFCNIQHLVFPNSLKTIGAMAFEYNYALETVTFGNGIETIGSNAFRDCNKLQYLYGPNTSQDNKALILNGVLSLVAKNGLTSFIVPSNVKEINNSCFNSFRNLSSITISEGVEKIGDFAFYGCDKLTTITIPSTVTEIGKGAFNAAYDDGKTAFYGKFASEDNRCLIIDGVLKASATKGIKEFIIPDGVQTIAYGVFSRSNMTSVTIPASVTTIEDMAFFSCSWLKTIYSYNRVAPSIEAYTFWGVTENNGTLYLPPTADYSTWLRTGDYYFGDYNWNVIEMYELYEPQTFFNLNIQAKDVSGRKTNTIIYWTCMSDGINTIDGTPIAGVQLSGKAISNEFPQNLSETETVEREITFEYQGLTATTTIIQGVWGDANYEVLLNDNWEKSTTIVNPNEDLYDGVYQSFSNKGKDNTAATMYIDIVGYENFKFYIRSYAESSFDYVMVSQLDTDIDNSTSYSNTNLVKEHTRGKSTSGTDISNYTLVEFTGLDKGEHRITVVYRKNGSSASGDDRGYVLIPFEQ